jgi:hypothetical protein
LISIQKERLLEVIKSGVAAFGLKQGTGQMSDLTPVRMTLTKDHPDAITVKPRLIGDVQEKWLQRRIEQLEAAGINKRVSAAKFASPIHTVPKKSEDPEAMALSGGYETDQQLYCQSFDTTTQFGTKDAAYS